METAIDSRDMLLISVVLKTVIRTVLDASKLQRLSQHDTTTKSNKNCNLELLNKTLGYLILTQLEIKRNKEIRELFNLKWNSTNEKKTSCYL